jgi:hypothetical protein
MKLFKNSKIPSQFYYQNYQILQQTDKKYQKKYETILIGLNVSKDKKVDIITSFVNLSKYIKILFSFRPPLRKNTLHLHTQIFSLLVDGIFYQKKYVIFNQIFPSLIKYFLKFPPSPAKEGVFVPTSQ